MAFTGKSTKDGKVAKYQMIPGLAGFIANDNDDVAVTDANTMKDDKARSAKMGMHMDFAWNDDVTVETDTESVATLVEYSKKVTPKATSAAGKTFKKALDANNVEEKYLDAIDFGNGAIESDTESIFTLVASPKKPYTKTSSAASRASSFNFDEETDFDWSDSESTIKAYSKKGNSSIKTFEEESCFETDSEWDNETLVNVNQHTGYAQTDTDTDTDSAATLVGSSRKTLRGKTLVKTLDASCTDMEDNEGYTFLGFPNKAAYEAATETPRNKDPEHKYFNNDFESSLSAFENMSLQCDSLFPKEPKDMSAEPAKSRSTKRDVAACAAAKEASYQGWLDRKNREQKLKLEAQRKKQKCREETEALRKQQAQERFNAWCKEKELQKKKEFEKFAGACKGNNLTGRVATTRTQAVPTPAQQAVKEWERAKDAKQKQQREKQRKAKEQKEREDEVRKQMSQNAWKNWEKNSKNRPKPVPLNQGIDSLRGTVSSIYINPNEWVSNLDVEETRNK